MHLRLRFSWHHRLTSHTLIISPTTSVKGLLQGRGASFRPSSNFSRKTCLVLNPEHYSDIVGYLLDRRMIILFSPSKYWTRFFPFHINKYSKIKRIKFHFRSCWLHLLVKVYRHVTSREMSTLYHLHFVFTWQQQKYLYNKIFVSPIRTSN